MSKNIVISASRRTDLVGCYPEIFLEKLQSLPPDDVHSLVIWTKNPENILSNKKLHDKLKEYKQIYIHLTITGMGASNLEPGIPNSDEIIKLLPKLIKFVKIPDRISWRFDPIIRAVKDEKTFTNLIYFPKLLEKIYPTGIKLCRTSWVFPYKKVCNHLEKSGYKLILPTDAQMKNDYDYMYKLLQKHNIDLAVCGTENFSISSCIDGNLLSNLHPEKLLCSLKKARGQRKFCGCTESLDIGSYSLKCLHGCLYCYANPIID